MSNTTKSKIVFPSMVPVIERLTWPAIPKKEIKEEIFEEPYDFGEHHLKMVVKSEVKQDPLELDIEKDPLDIKQIPNAEIKGEVIEDEDDFENDIKLERIGKEENSSNLSDTESQWMNCDTDSGESVRSPTNKDYEDEDYESDGEDLEYKRPVVNESNNISTKETDSRDRSPTNKDYEDTDESYGEDFSYKRPVGNKSNNLPTEETNPRDRSPINKDKKNGAGSDSGYLKDKSLIRKNLKKCSPNRRVFVTNIPYAITGQELKDLFVTEVGEVLSCELYKDEYDRPKGSAVVEFESEELAVKAIEKLHRYYIKGRKLAVRKYLYTERNNNSNFSFRRGGFYNSHSDFNISTSKWGFTYGLRPQFLESLRISGSLVPRVFVANLDPKVDEEKLKEVFQLAGTVLSAVISLDEEGKGQKFGFVQYGHPVEAVQAISMLNNQMLYGRRLYVKMDHVFKNKYPKLPEGLESIGMGLGENGMPLYNFQQSSTQYEKFNLSISDTAIIEKLLGSIASNE